MSEQEKTEEYKKKVIDRGGRPLEQVFLKCADAAIPQQLLPFSRGLASSFNGFLTEVQGMREELHALKDMNAALFAVLIENGTLTAAEANRVLGGHETYPLIEVEEEK